jgi:hypothetical protein
MIPLNLKDSKGNKSPSKEKAEMKTAWQDHIPLKLHKYSEVSHEHPTVNSVWETRVWEKILSARSVGWNEIASQVRGP